MSNFDVSRLRSFIPIIVRALPPVALGFGLFFCGIITGLAARHYQWQAYYSLKSAQIVASSVYTHLFTRPHYVVTQISIRDLTRARIKTVTPNTYPEAFMFTSGFHDLCPESGCLYVVMSRDGKVLKHVPFRPKQLFAKNIAPMPYEHLFFNATKDVEPWVALPFSGGDWIVSVAFVGDSSFPVGGGLARLRDDGSVVWYRGDYSHHWVSLLSNGDAVTPSDFLTSDPIEIKMNDMTTWKVRCGPITGRNIIRVVTPGGAEKEAISVPDALANSPFKAHFFDEADPCNSIHLNFVREVDADTARKLGDEVSPGDLLVSMRNLSAFGIISRKTKTFIRLFHGTFAFQHSVQPLTGTKVIMLDNMGGPVRGTSRVLIYDMATGEERTVFPTSATPGVVTFVAAGGYIDVSADRRRALVSFSDAGVGYEIDLSDGKIITEFDSLDVTPQLPGKVIRVSAPSLRYVNER